MEDIANPLERDDHVPEYGIKNLVPVSGKAQHDSDPKIHIFKITQNFRGPTMKFSRHILAL